MDRVNDLFSESNPQRMGNTTVFALFYNVFCGIVILRTGLINISSFMWNLIIYIPVRLFPIINFLVNMKNKCFNYDKFLKCVLSS